MDTSEPTPGTTPQPTEPISSPPNSPEAPTPELNPSPTHSPRRWLGRFSRKQVAILAAITLVLIAAVAGGAWALLGHHVGPSNPATTNQSTANTGSTATRTIAGVTFLASAKKLDNLHLFTNYNSFFESKCLNNDCSAQTASVTDNDVAYYQIGTMKGGQTLLDVQVSEPVVSVSSTTYDFIFEQNSYGQYVLLTTPSGLRLEEIADLQKTLTPSVVTDTVTDISALHFPQTLSVTGKNGKTVTLSRILSSDLGTLNPNGLGHISAFNDRTYASTVFGASDTYTAYEIDESSDSSYRMLAWYAGLNNMYVAPYQLKDAVASTNNTNAAGIIWNDGSINTTGYNNSVQPVGGCGYADVYVALPAQTPLNSLSKIGAGPNGTTIYALANDSPLLKTYTGRTMDPTTVTELQAKRGLIIATNAAGELGVYGRNDLFLVGGCGEPVVYLYPTKPTYVDVRVGAQVVKSDPSYPAATGWQHVLAQPSGQLSYQGKPYSSLLWEGYGNGQYPAITSGTVVPGNQAAATVRAQMKTLGFLPNEIDDFMAFWGPQLPHTPYVRLTWFTTSEVQALAPLTVWPQPNTVLRAFLDFEGLQKPVSLPAQQLTNTPRRGFTVVEWGGLLRGGIN